MQNSEGKDTRGERFRSELLWLAVEMRLFTLSFNYQVSSGYPSLPISGLFSFVSLITRLYPFRALLHSSFNVRGNTLSCMAFRSIVGNELNVVYGGKGNIALYFLRDCSSQKY